MRRSCVRLRQTLVQPLQFQGDPNKDAEGWRKSGRTSAGGQFGTKSAPTTGRPFLFDGPDDLPFWHHVGDVWRPQLDPQASISGHATALPSLEGEGELTPGLVAVRPLLRSIILHRNSERGPANALERWEAVKRGHKEGIFDARAVHRAGFFVLDVLAEHRDYDAAAFVYDELHGGGADGMGLPLDAGHVEKMVWLCYAAERYSDCANYMAQALKANAGAMLKTATWAAAMACHGRNLEGAKGLDMWEDWILLGRPVSSFPPSFLSELVMGCIEDAEIEGAKRVLRHFNDLYIERVWNYCRSSGMDNDAMIYYTEWLYKSRRHTLFDPSLNIHFMRYAFKRVTER